MILLTVLAGLATTGTASLSDTGILVAKLAMFCVVGLMIGAMLGNRVMNALSRSQSDETLLTSLSRFLLPVGPVCHPSWTLAGAAGAFLVGVVIGDTDAASRITRMISPVRDMFGALFFLSIGMLIDYRTLDDYIVPALVIVEVFVLGKIAASTVGSILAGRRFNDALQVGMTMPQMGEFSLAIGRLSPGNAAGVSPLGAVLSIVTAIMSVIAPLTSRSASNLAWLVDRFTPAPLTWIILSVQLGVDTFWSALSLTGNSGERFRHVRQGIFMNVAIVGFLSTIGTGVLYIAPEAVGNLLSVPSGSSRIDHGRAGNRFEHSVRHHHLAFIGYPGKSCHQWLRRYAPCP